MKSTSRFRSVLLILVAVMLYGCATNSLPRVDLALYRAVDRQDIAAAERALRAGANPNANRAGYSTVLQSAVESNNPALVEFVLKAGGDPNFCLPRCPDDPLTLALNSARSSSKHANEDADRETIVALLLRAGADPNGQPDASWTPLVRAIDSGQTRIAILLLEAGASPQGSVPTAGRRCVSGPLQMALIRSDHAMAERLVTMGAKLDCHSDLFKELARNGDVKSLKMALELTSSEEGRYLLSALIEATKKNCAECVRLLLEAGVLQDNYRGSYWFEFIGGTEANILDLYAAHGLDFRAKDDNNSTLLHFAASSGNTEGIKWFVLHGVPVDALDRTRRTPLMIAAERGHTEAVRALLDAGANSASLDGEGRTAKVLAAQVPERTKAHNEVERLLHARGALEYAGMQLPPSKYDAEVAGKTQNDVTGDFYAKLPFLKPGLRLFLTYMPPEQSNLMRPHAIPDIPDNDSIPAKVTRLYAVLPDRNVIKLEQPDDIHTLGMQLRSPDDALTLVRFYTYPSPFLATRLVASSVQFERNMYSELPENDENSCYRLSGWVGPHKPVVVLETTADGMYYVVTRYMIPLDSVRSRRSNPLHLDEILRVTERVRSDGAYSLESTEILVTPGLLLHWCAVL